MEDIVIDGDGNPVIIDNLDLPEEVDRVALQQGGY